MKLFVPALLLVISAAAMAASAQEYAPPQRTGAAAMSGLMNPAPQRAPDQAGCPVMLSSAHLNWPASYLPVTSAEKVTEPNLALGYQNLSGKAIRSVTIDARFLGKQSVYQLDASAFDLRLNFSGIDSADQLREIRLPAKMYAYGVTRVSLEQVLFADGTMWTSFGHGNCRLDVQGSTQRVQAQ